MPFAPEDFPVVRFPDPIRRRPAMYVGDLGPVGLHELARRLMECPRDPTAITVTLPPRGVLIDAECVGPSFVPRAPDRPAFLVDAASRLALPLDDPPTLAAEEAFDTQSDPARFVRTERAPMALAIANALASTMTLASRRDGLLARARFARGVLVEPMAIEATRAPNGMTISFEPDPEIFTEPLFRFHAVASIARDISAVRRFPIRVIDTQSAVSYLTSPGSIEANR